MNLKIISISLGEVEIEAAHINIGQIKEILKKSGFALLEDKNFRIIERIKTLIIELVHHQKEFEFNQNMSSYISHQLGMDYNYLSSLFSSLENQTIEKFIIHQKIEKVKELLVYDELSITEISYQLAYSSVAHLSAQFKQVTGLSPSAFKKIKGSKRNSLDKI